MAGSVNIHRKYKIGSPSMKTRRRTFIFLLILFISVVFSICFPLLKIHSSHKVVDSLSQEEQKELKLFFYDLFAKNELGYTLFGDKPMSICWPMTLSPRFSQKTNTPRLYVESTRPLFRGLKAWEKVSPKTGHNYLLIICKERRFPSFTILINKQCFEREFLRNIDLFEKYYGKNVTAEQVVESLLKKPSYEEIARTPLFQNDILLGISLGFGRHNSELFQRREELTSHKSSIIMPKPGDGFSSIEEEIHYLWAHLKSSRKTVDWQMRVTGVGFAGDPDHPETHELTKKYDLLQEKLVAIFDREDWLETVLSQFRR